MRCLIKLTILTTVVLGGVAGTVYWMYRGQVKDAVAKAEKLVSLKNEITSIKTKLADARAIWKKKELSLKPEDNDALRAAQKKISKLESANRKLGGFMTLEFNGTKINSPDELKLILGKLEEILELKLHVNPKN